MMMMMMMMMSHVHLHYRSVYYKFQHSCAKNDFVSAHSRLRSAQPIDAGNLTARSKLPKTPLEDRIPPF